MHMCACKQRTTSAISTWMASLLFSETASLTCPEFISYCREQKSWDGAFWPLGRRNYSTPSHLSMFVIYRKVIMVYSWPGGRVVIHSYTRRQGLWYTADQGDKF